MVSEKTSFKDRISNDWERVRSLEEKGLDLSKVRKIMDNIESKSETASEQQMEPAIVKLEKYLAIMENKLRKKRVRKVAVDKEKKEPETPVSDEASEEIEGGSEDDISPPPSEEQVDVGDGTIGPSGIQEDVPEGMEPDEIAEDIPEDVPPQDDGSRPDTDHGILKEQSEGDGGPASEEAPLNEETPSSEPPEGPEAEEQLPEPVFDTEKASKELEAVRSQVAEIREFGGDPAPISPHVKTLSSSLLNKDSTTFEQYLPIVHDWIEKYLLTLRRSRIDSISSTVQMILDVHVAFDNAKQVEGPSKEFDRLMSGLEGADLAGLGDVLLDMVDLEGRLEKGYGELKEKVVVSLDERINSIISQLAELEDTIDQDTFQKSIDLVREAVSKNELILASTNLKELENTILDEKRSIKVRKLDKYLVSMEPLIEKIKEGRGEDSKDHMSLQEEKEEILALSETDIDSSLEKVGKLLDRTTLLIVEIEEKMVERLEESILSEKKKATKLSDIMETGPVITILEKADDFLQEGTIDQASKLLDRAIVVFGNLQRQKEKEDIKVSLERYESKVKEYREIGLDVSPMKEPLVEAWNGLKGDDREKVKRYIEQIEDRLSYLRVEELKLVYQKVLINIINSLKRLRENGDDVRELETRLDDLKLLYMDRKFEEAIQAASELENAVSRLKLGKVLEERFIKIRETVTEAEGLLVDVEGPKQKLVEADELRGAGDLSASLDMLVNAQVEIEDMMTRRTFSFIEKEIRNIVDECKRFSIEIGDTESIMNQAYGLADDDNYREAMDLLANFRDKLSKKMMLKRADVQITKLGNKIKEARPLKLNVSMYKAALTKARVLLDAGDVESAFELTKSDLAKIEDEIMLSRQARSRLDKLRGRLLAQEGKLSRLVRDDIDIRGMDQKVSDIRDLIDALKTDEVEDQINDLEVAINTILTHRPEQLKKEMVSTLVEKKDEPRPLSIDVKKEERAPLKAVDTTPEKARSELFILIPKIKTEITRLNSKGIDTESYKREIAGIQKMVMERKYVDAVTQAKGCFIKMTV